MNWLSRFGNMESLTHAWNSVRANGGCAGIDGQEVANFSKDSQNLLGQISARVLSDRYHYSRLRMAKIPKTGGKLRKLGIPTIGDRIVLQSIKRSIEPECERHLLPCAHAYRPQRGTHTALADISTLLEQGFCFVLESDIQTFFDSISHHRLRAELGQINRELPKLKLIRSALTMSTGMWAAKKGISQGSPLSPLLANVALIDFDREMIGAGHRLVRYADDFVVLSQTNAGSEQALKDAKKLLRKLRLRIHPDKTQLLDNHRESFRFVGFEIHPDRIVPTAENLAELRSGILAWANPHAAYDWHQRIERINGLLRSFAWYYHQTDSKRLFWSLDALVREQLEQLEAKIECPEHSQWRSSIIRISDMREVSWRGKRKTNKRGWNGYGK